MKGFAQGFDVGMARRQAGDRAGSAEDVPSAKLLFTLPEDRGSGVLNIWRRGVSLGIRDEDRMR